MKKIVYLQIAFLLLIATKMNAQQYGLGTNTPQATLDITSTSSGILMPRMTTTQRDAIVSPPNSMLIWNINNNGFEVFKSSCSCWVAIIDAGNTAANTLVNTPPIASSLNYTGNFRAGSSATLNYTYSDLQNDLEGLTTIKWEIANDNQGTGTTNLNSGATANFNINHIGKWVRAIVTPRAATGMLNGINYFGGWIQIVSGSLPYASNISASGTLTQGSTLTGNYVFNGGSGVENTLGSLYSWQTATTNLGAGIQGVGASLTYIPQFNDFGRFIRFGVLARDNVNVQATNYVYGDWIGPITLAAEAAPVVTNLTYSPAPGTNVTLNAHYTFLDANNDPEGTSVYQWYIADDAAGTNQTEITGANNLSFPVTSAQQNKYVGIGVTPKALTGILTGNQVVYYSGTPSVPAADFSLVSVTQISNNFFAGRAMDGITDAIQVRLNVTSPGSMFISSTTVNGYSFNYGGNLATGTQDVIIFASGTQTAFNSGGDTFTINLLGSTNETTNITISNVRKGSEFTNFFNGITGGISVDYMLSSYTSGEAFSTNSICSTKPISASPCSGSSITIGSNTYPIATINGQCWMTQNYRELPNNVAVNASQWLVSAPGDLGYYGFYNNATITGAAGWATTEPAVGEGLLYQWSAIMNGTTAERAKGICPTGWHVPSDCEWMYLEHGLGMQVSEQIKTAWRSNSNDNQGAVAYKLRSGTATGTVPNNVSGFALTFSGFRHANGYFSQRAGIAYLWSSTQVNATTNLARYIQSGTSRGVNRDGFARGHAATLRCLRD